MGLGRRKVSLHDPKAWVFNRMADVYEARPAYPDALLDALAALAGPVGCRVGDLGAGIGHVALPLAERGYDVIAVEPAQAMLDRLARAAKERGLELHVHHAAAEALPIESSSLELVIVADALHFLDAERAGHEIGRVLTPGGRLALITCEIGDAPFMRGLVRLMEEAAPRRPRDISGNMAQLAAVADVTLTNEQRFEDATPVDAPTLERILRSISFIGPAMNAERFAAFRERVQALPGERVWARTFTLRTGVKR